MGAVNGSLYPSPARRWQPGASLPLPFSRKVRSNKDLAVDPLPEEAPIVIR
jgi:hypothetical protein